MAHELIWVEKDRFQGWTCSVCGWEFKSSGPLVGNTIDEMKLAYERQRDIGIDLVRVSRTNVMSSQSFTRTLGRVSELAELADLADQAVLDRLSQKPTSLIALTAIVDANPFHLRSSLKRLFRAGKVRRFRRNRETFYSIAEGAREIGRF